MIDAFSLADSLRDGFGTRSVSVEITDEPIEVPVCARGYLDHGLPAARQAVPADAGRNGYALCAAWTESLAK